MMNMDVWKKVKVIEQLLESVCKKKSITANWINRLNESVENFIMDFVFDNYEELSDENIECLGYTRKELHDRWGL